MTKENKYLIITVSLVLISIVLRILGIKYGYPDVTITDEPYEIRNAIFLLANKTYIPYAMSHPPVYQYLLAVSYAVTFLFFKIFYGFSQNDFGALFLSNIGIFMLIGRVISLLFSFLSLAVFYKLLKFLDLKGQQLFWSFMVFAFCITSMKVAHWAWSDSLLLFASSISAYYLIKYSRTGSFRSLLIFIFILAVSINIKYNAILLAIGLIPVFWNNKFNDLKKFSNILLILLFLILGLFISSPAIFLNPGRVIQDYIATKQALEVSGEGGMPYFWVLFELIKEEKIWGILILVSTVTLFLKKGKSDYEIIFLLIAIISFLYIGTFTYHKLKYFIFILPLASVIMVNEVFRLFKDKYLPGIILSAGLIFNIYSATGYDVIFLNEDTRIIAENWIENNIPEGSNILISTSSQGDANVSPPLKPHYFVTKNIESKKLNNQDVIKKYYENISSDKKYNLFSNEKNLDWRSKENISSLITDSLFMNLIEIKEKKIGYFVISDWCYNTYFDFSFKINKNSKDKQDKINYLYYSYYMNVLNHYPMKMINHIKNDSDGPVIDIYEFKFD